MADHIPTTATKLPETFCISDETRSQLSPVLRAGLRIAEKAHAGEIRKTSEFSMPYIHHTILAMNVLKHIGIRDEVTLAAALLHDALEQGRYNYKEYWNKQEEADHGTIEAFERAQLRAGVALADELRTAINEEFETEPSPFTKQKADYLAHQATALIVDVVKQLTNPPIPKTRIQQDGRAITVEHKRFIQIDKAYKYTPRAKRVKMADLASNMIGDLLYPSSQSTESLKIMHNRAMSISCECADVRPDLHDMVIRLARANHELFADMRERPDRDGFSLDDFVTPHHRNRNHIMWVNEPSSVDKGILSVGLDAYTGKVEAFRIMDDPGRSAHEFGLFDQLNHVKSEIVNAIGTGECSIMRIGTTSLFDGEFITRKVSIIPAISLDKFIGYAKQTHAISDELIEQIPVELQQARDDKRPPHRISPIITQARGWEGIITGGKHTLQLQA